MSGSFPGTAFPNRELPDDPILDAMPDLAVEVISKGNTPREMDLKLKDYFQAGVRLVWFIYPKTQTALVYTSPTRQEGIGLDGALDGGKVLPGFSPAAQKAVHALVAARRNGTLTPRK